MNNEQLLDTSELINALRTYRLLKEKSPQLNNNSRIKHIQYLLVGREVKEITVSELKTKVFDQLNKVIPDKETLVRMQHIVHRANDWDIETKEKLERLLAELIRQV